MDSTEAAPSIDVRRLLMATGAGLGAAIVGAIVWAVVTVMTNYQIGFMAIAVGFIVGRAVGMLAASQNQVYGIAGAVLALIGCVLGNLLTAVGFYAQATGIGFFDALSLLDVDMAVRLMTAMFEPIDLLFYGIAVYEGYRFAIVR